MIRRNGLARQGAKRYVRAAAIAVPVLLTIATGIGEHSSAAYAQTTGSSSTPNWRLTPASDSDVLYTPSGKPVNLAADATGPLPFGDMRKSASEDREFALGKLGLGRGAFRGIYSHNDPAPTIEFVYPLNNGRGNGRVDAVLAGYKGNHAFVTINDDQRAAGAIVGSDGGVYTAGRPLPTGVTAVGDLQRKILKVATDGSYVITDLVKPPTDLVKVKIPEFHPTQTATSQDQLVDWLDAKLKAANTPK